MSSIATANLRAHKRQYVATSIAIIVCCIFITVAASVGNMFIWISGNENGAQYQGASVVVSDSAHPQDTEKAVLDLAQKQAKRLGKPVPEKITDELMDKYTGSQAAKTYEKLGRDYKEIQSALGAGWKVFPEYSTRSRVTFKDTTLPVRVDTLLPKPFYQPPITKGKAATEPGTIVLAPTYLKTLKAKVGDTLKLSYTYYPSPVKHTVQQVDGTTIEKEIPAEPEERSVQVRLVGMIGENASMKMGNTPMAYLDADTFSNVLPDSSPKDILFAAPDGMSQSEAKDKVNSYLLDHDAISVNIKVQSVQDMDTDSVRSTATNASIRAATLIFPALSLLVCMLIISVTFRVVLARRRREIALMRCVGATSQQVRRFTLLECLLVGLFSSIVGTILGVALTLFLSWYFAIVGSVKLTLYVVGTYPLVISIVAGTGVTVLAGLRPTLGISKIRPLAALQPAELSPAFRRKRHIVRGIFATLFTLGGLAAWGGSRMVQEIGLKQLEKENQPDLGLYFMGGLGLAFLGSILLFIALLLVCLSFLPRFASLLTAPFKRVSPTMKMAGLNVMRDPARVGATGMALVLGVTLIGSLMIATTSTKNTINDAIDTMFPVDLIVSTPQDKALTPEQLNTIQNAPGVQKTLPLDTVNLAVVKTADGKLYELTDLTNADKYVPGQRADIEQSLAEGVITPEEAEEQKAGLAQKEALRKSLNPLTTNPKEYGELTGLYGSKVLLAPSADKLKQVAPRATKLPVGNELWVAVSSEKNRKQFEERFANQTFQVAFTGANKWIPVKIKAVNNIDLLAWNGVSPVDAALSPSLSAQLVTDGATVTNSLIVAKMDKHSDSYQLFNSFTKIFTSFKQPAPMGGSILIVSMVTIVIDVFSIILLSLLSVSVLVAFIGVFNTLTLSTVDRARENALLRALGFTRRQIRRMLLIEGSLIGVGSLIVGFAASSLFAWFMVSAIPFQAVSKQIQPTIVFPWLQLAGILAVTLGACMLAALLPGRKAAQASPVEALADVR